MKFVKVFLEENIPFRLTIEEKRIISLQEIFFSCSSLFDNLDEKSF